jgi:hypothetical protein
MIGDSWYANIGNGYAIGMIDVMDQGVLYPSDGDINGPGAIDGVRRLQIVATKYLELAIRSPLNTLGTSCK